MTRAWLLIVCALIVMGYATEASAHARSLAYSRWTVDGSAATVRVRVSALDANALEASCLAAAGPEGDSSLSDRVTDRLRARLRLETATGPCDAGPAQVVESAEGWRTYQWSLRCDGVPAVVVNDLLVDLVPNQVHFASIGRTGADRAVEVVLNEQDRRAELPRTIPSTGALATLGTFVPVGLRHILSGWDHLVFLFALVLVGRSLRSLGVVATGFTVGHSVTLALAVTGFARADRGTVEALIGLSIALLAVENVWRQDRFKGAVLPMATVSMLLVSVLLAVATGLISALALGGIAIFAACYFGLLRGSRSPDRLRAAVAVLFGLVHGFGFAGALNEMKLPAARLGMALLGFNLGVEAGQLAVLAGLFAVVLAVRRWGDGKERFLVAWGSAAAATAGVFWFVSRTFVG